MPKDVVVDSLYSKLVQTAIKERANTVRKVGNTARRIAQGLGSEATLLADQYTWAIGLPGGTKLLLAPGRVTCDVDCVSGLIGFSLTKPPVLYERSEGGERFVIFKHTIGKPGLLAVTASGVATYHSDTKGPLPPHLLGSRKI